MHTCISCGYCSEEVEMRGIYYCPNIVCTVSGATCHKTKFETYTDDPPRVDPREVVQVGHRLLETYTDESMKKAIRESLKFWEPKASFLEVCEILEA